MNVDVDGIRSIRIRIRPENRALYFTAHVFPTREVMWRAMEAIGLDVDPNDPPGACCLPFTRVKVTDSSSRVRPHCGVLFFCQQQLDAETISHECLHATWAWSKRVGWQPDDEESYETEQEERFCYAHGRMVGQLVDRLTKLGLPEGSAA